MAYIARDPEQHVDGTFGDGQCVAFVQECAGAPITHDWKEGEKVRGADIPKGTAIATFQNGKYQNDKNGNSHAAIYLEQDDRAIYVLDQWVGKKGVQPVHRRPIWFRGGEDEPRNDGDAYSVIE